VVFYGFFPLKNQLNHFHKRFCRFGPPPCNIPHLSSTWQSGKKLSLITTGLLQITYAPHTKKVNSKKKHGLKLPPPFPKIKKKSFKFPFVIDFFYWENQQKSGNSMMEFADGFQV